LELQRMKSSKMLPMESKSRIGSLESKWISYWRQDLAISTSKNQSNSNLITWFNKQLIQKIKWIY
jgi:hypothetical protein